MTRDNRVGLSAEADAVVLLDRGGNVLLSEETVDELMSSAMVSGKRLAEFTARAVELVKLRLTEGGEITWTLDDEGGCQSDFDASSDMAEATAEEVATSWVTTSELGSTLNIEAEWWPTVLGRELASRHDLVFSGEWAFEPDEPECSGDEGHDWDSEDGAFASGHGSQGVVEVCRRCGIRKTWDGGASDSHGEQIEVTSYERPE